MYHLVPAKDKFSWYFTTDSGIKYFIFFSSQKELFPGKEYASDVYYFGFLNQNSTSGSDILQADLRIKQTVINTIPVFFKQKNFDPILIFNYLNSDGRAKARKRIFNQWFNEFSESYTLELINIDYPEVSLSILSGEQNQLAKMFEADLLNYFEELFKAKSA